MFAADLMAAGLCMCGHTHVTKPSSLIGDLVRALHARREDLARLAVLLHERLHQADNIYHNKYLMFKFW